MRQGQGGDLGGWDSAPRSSGPRPSLPGCSGSAGQAPSVPLASSAWALQHGHRGKDRAVLGEPPSSRGPAAAGVSQGPGGEDLVLQGATRQERPCPPRHTWSSRAPGGIRRGLSRAGRAQFRLVRPPELAGRHGPSSSASLSVDLLGEPQGPRLFEEVMSVVSASRLRVSKLGPQLLVSLRASCPVGSQQL